MEEMSDRDDLFRGELLIVAKGNGPYYDKLRIAQSKQSAEINERNIRIAEFVKATDSTKLDEDSLRMSERHYTSSIYDDFERNLVNHHG